MRYSRVGLVILFVALGVFALSRGAAPRPVAPVAPDPGKLPLAFEPNAGQAGRGGALRGARPRGRAGLRRRRRDAGA